MPARCTIDGSDVPLDRVMKRIMNFGQEIAVREPLPYTIVVPRGELDAILAEPMARVREELRADAPYDDEDFEALPLAELIRRT